MSGYIGTQPVPQATQTRDAFTATAGQTSFATAGYTPSFLDVYLNGIKLAAADYTASNGSDVVLASGAALDDILEVVAYTSFEVVTDTVTNAGTVLNLDRTGSDGTILDLKKDGSTVGSIGNTGSRMYLGSGDVGAAFQSDVDKRFYPVDPSNGGAGKDAYIDLGRNNVRWKDLYLSGGVYLGGTGSANKLDDYEEGTWTPTSTSTAFPTAQGRYTKVGRLVYASFYIQVATSINANFFQLSGLPFVNGNSTGGQNLGSMGNTDMGTNQFTFHVAGSGSSILLRNLSNTDWLRYNAYAGKSIWGAVTYTSS